MNTPSNPIFAKFDQAVGTTTPTTATGPVQSRADEIRSLAKTSASPQAPAQTNPNDLQHRAPSIVSGAINSLLDTTVNNTKDIQKSSANNIVSDVKNGADSFAQAGQDLANGSVAGALKNTGKGVLQSGLGTASDAINYFLAPLSASVKTVTDTVAGNNPNAKGISDIPAVQKIATGPVGDTMQQAQDALSKAAESHPVLAKALVDAFNVATTAAGGSKLPEAGSILGEGISKDLTTIGNGAKSVVNEASNIASDVGTVTKNKLSSIIPEPKTPVLNESSITDKYNRAIKPSVTGKSTAGQIADSNSRTVSGLKSIVENKPNLEFTDSEGNIVKGETPKTVDQFSQSIQQTKSSIFKQYDALAKEAGEKGITVDAASIAKELDPVINSKSLQISNPKAIEYARDLQLRLAAHGGVDAETAQEVIQNYNAELKAYYRNPTPGMASNVQIDAMIANKFRTLLDEGISGATGKQYQALKTQYGALASMEKDVARRAATLAKQSKAGFVSNMSNIASGAELVRGLIRLNPADLAVSGTVKAIQMYTKYLNNPDVGISKMFDELTRSSPSPIAPKPGEGALKTGDTSSPNPTTFQPKSKLGKTMQEAVESGTNRGFAKIPGSPKIHPDDLAEMKDFTDYVGGGYKPDAKAAQALELSASRIAEKYGIKQYKSTKGLANEFGRILDKQN